MMMSDQAKVSLVVGAGVAIVSGRLSRRDDEILDIKSVLLVMLSYAVIAYNSNCLATGRCQSWSWISVAAPVLMGIMFIWAGAVGQK